MKIFNRVKPWYDKVNFVDDNNVMLGYDMGQCCCEIADWFIADAPMEAASYNHEGGPEEDLTGWNFDPTFFTEAPGTDMDSGGVAIFRIINGDQQKFIHLYNCHNGYYSHGFDFTRGDETIQSGYL